MAVYTEVSDDELAALHRQLRSGRAALLQGHRRGRREHQLSRPHREGPVHPDALREARRPGRPAVLPRPDGAPGQGRLNCPTPVRDAQGRMLRTLAGKPAALVTFLEGVWIRRPQPRHCAAVGQALAALHLAGRELHAAARQRAGRSPAGGRSISASAPRADEIAPGLAAIIEQELDHLEATGRPTCRRASSTPTCFPTTSSSSATSSPA